MIKQKVYAVMRESSSERSYEVEKIVLTEEAADRFLRLARLNYGYYHIQEFEIDE